MHLLDNTKTFEITSLLSGACMNLTSAPEKTNCDLSKNLWKLKFVVKKIRFSNLILFRFIGLLRKVLF